MLRSSKVFFSGSVDDRVRTAVVAAAAAECFIVLLAFFVLSRFFSLSFPATALTVLVAAAVALFFGLGLAKGVAAPLERLVRLAGSLERNPDALFAVDTGSHETDGLLRLLCRLNERSLSGDAKETELQGLAAKKFDLENRIAVLMADLEAARSLLHDARDSVASAAMLAAAAHDNAARLSGAGRDNLAAMTGVRRQVNDAAKRLKQLGERVQESSQAAAQFTELSEQISLLSLNASLRGTADGGRIVSEVERLAGRSSRLDRQIASLSAAIAGETSEVAASTDSAIREVVSASTLIENSAASAAEAETRLAALADSLASLAEHLRPAEAPAESFISAPVETVEEAFVN